MPNTKDTHDPFNGYNFWVEWDGIVHAGFRECSGLNASRTANAYREGTDKILASRQVPGLTSFGNITLKRGITDNKELWEWHEKYLKGEKPERKSVSIILADDQGEEKLRWDLDKCWPVNWSGPEFNATASEIAIESLEFIHEGIKMG